MNTFHPHINASDWAFEQASELKSTFKQDIETFGGVYLALMVSDDGWGIEIEVNEGTIAATYRTNLEDLGKARQIADEIEDMLAHSGIKVYKTRGAWEDALCFSGAGKGD